MRSRPAAPSSPRLTVLLLPLLSTWKLFKILLLWIVWIGNCTSPDSTLFSLALLFLFPGVTAWLFRPGSWWPDLASAWSKMSTPVCSGRRKCYLLLTFFFLLPAAWVTLGFLFSGLSSTAILLNFRFLLLFARNSWCVGYNKVFRGKLNQLWMERYFHWRSPIQPLEALRLPLLSLFCTHAVWGESALEGSYIGKQELTWRVDSCQACHGNQWVQYLVLCRCRWIGGCSFPCSVTSLN